MPVIYLGRLKKQVIFCFSLFFLTRRIFILKSQYFVNIYVKIWTIRTVCLDSLKGKQSNLLHCCHPQSYTAVHAPLSFLLQQGWIFFFLINLWFPLSPNIFFINLNKTGILTVPTPYSSVHVWLFRVTSHRQPLNWESQIWCKAFVSKYLADYD